MTSLEEVLSKAVKDSASDIFIVAGGYLSYKVDGEIRSMDESMKLTPTETSYFIDEIYSFAKRSKEYYLQQGDDDFSFAIGKLARFRVNTYMQRGSQAAVIRVVAFDIPDYKELDIPDGIMELAELKHGMVIISGTVVSLRPRPASLMPLTARERRISLRWRIRLSIFMQINSLLSVRERLPLIRKIT